MFVEKRKVNKDIVSDFEHSMYACTEKTWKYDAISSLWNFVSEVIGMQVFSRVSARTDQVEFGNGRTYVRV